MGSVQAPREGGLPAWAKAGPEALHELLTEAQVLTRDSEGGFTRDCELDSSGGGAGRSAKRLPPAGARILTLVWEVCLFTKKLFPPWHVCYFGILSLLFNKACPCSAWGGQTFL